MKTTKFKKYKILFCAILICGGFLLACLLLPAMSQAAPNASTPNWTMPDIQIDISGLKKFTTPTACSDDSTKICVPWIGEYIQAIYNYAIGIIGILAAIVLMFGGVLWLTAGGNSSQVAKAKDLIGGSLTGLVIAMTSYIILYQINPDLTVLKPVRITKIEQIPEATVSTTGCSWVKDSIDEFGAGTTKCTSDTKESTDKSKCPTPTEAQKSLHSCCCPTLGGTAMCKSTAPTPTYCQACNNCETTTVPCKESPCLVNKNLNTKLKNVSFSGWQITEPWPPTVPHQSSCHKDGTCVDVNLTADKDNVTKIKALYDALKNAGLNPLYESTTDCTPLVAAGVNNCIKYAATASSFHVKQ